MLARIRVAHPLLFALIAYLVFFLGLNGMGRVTGVLVDTCFGGDAGILGGLLVDMACEAVPALLLYLVLFRTGRLGLLTKKGRGFAAGLRTGGYCLGFIAAAAGQALLAGFAQGYGINLAGASVVYVLFMLMVGVTEEIVARALIAETFLEHFGTAREGALRAALASGVIFGAMHLTNAIGGNLPGTMIQVSLCVTAGVLYAAVYFRSGNLWSIVLIHGLNDVAAGTVEWLFNGGAYLPTTSTGIEPADLVIPIIIGVLDLVAAFYVLRPKKADEIRQAWPEIQAPEIQASEIQASENGETAA
ncbi:MAG: type II CAAX endopeptidase family protein [Coriobacteriia bacterium]|nr:type II CAAX endopeptidase family protein [Coriobacteriia bacterium]